MRPWLLTCIMIAIGGTPSFARPCVAVVDRQEFTARTERIFSGLRGAGIDAVRWHIVANRRLPAGDLEITTAVFKAIAPKLLIMHFSAFYPQWNATDNKLFGTFFAAIEKTGDRPHYVIYSRVPLDKAGMAAEISQHSDIPSSDFADRLSFVQVFDGNEDKAVSDIALAIGKLDLTAICAGG